MIEVMIAPDETREEIWELYQEYALELAAFYDDKERRNAHYDVCFDDYWDNDTRTPFMILYDHELIGFCLLTDTGVHYMIDEFYIRPLHRKRGFGKAAVQHVLDYCRSLHRHESVGANVQVANTDAIAFWKSLGFQDTGRRTRIGKQRLIETEARLTDQVGEHKMS